MKRLKQKQIEKNAKRYGDREKHKTEIETEKNDPQEKQIAKKDWKRLSR